MAEPNQSDTQKKNPQLILHYAAENRRSEISLLWTRSAFFWAFLAVAIVSFGGAVHFQHRSLALLVACFAAVCSLGEPSWKILARNLGEERRACRERGIGRRHVQQKKRNPGKLVLGRKELLAVKTDSGCKRPHISAWSILAVGTALIDIPHPITLLRIVLLMLTLIYAAGILVWCKSEAQRPSNIKDAWTQFSEAVFKWKPQ